MFKIYDGREHFYQWDLDRKLIVADRSIAAVHFCNRTSDCALARDCYELEGNWVVDVPNICLQEDYRLKVYGYSEAKYTVLSDCFEIEARTKPEEYAYTEDEINCWQELDERLTRFEENIEEAIAEEVEAYLAAHPVEKGATDAEKEQIARNAEDIAALKAQADTYATEEYVDAAIANIEVGGGGECIVNVINSTGEDTVELDKTYDEVKAMVEAGKIVVILHANNLYYLTDKNTLTFRHLGSSTIDYIRLRDANRTQFSTITLATEDYVNDNAGSGVEIVNATGDETIELDKTYDEIMAMIEAGKNVVINYDGYLYHQFSDTPVFCYVGSMETRQISFNKRDYSVRYSENIVPAYEDVGTIVEEMLEDRNYQTAEQVNAAIANYVGVIENGTY